MTEIKVRKVGKEWIAEDGVYITSAFTKREALMRLADRRERDALDIPEIRVIQQRWVASIEAIVPGLDPNDAYARVWLAGLRSDIESFEAMARTQALLIEKRIRELRERMAMPKEIA